MFDLFELISNFLDAGGQILKVILVATVLLWALIAERFLFLRSTFPTLIKSRVEKWQQRNEFSSWKAHRIREALLSQADLELKQFVSTIKTLVALCPLLGLLGTVTGMIAVFDVMAAVGTGSARSMASGISMATIPSMAGMVASISGIYFGSWLDKKVLASKEAYSELLVIE